MALSNSFAAANYTQADVDALVGDLDSDPRNTLRFMAFGMTLEGQSPFPAALFDAANNEMLRRYDEVHIPQANESAAAEEGRWRAKNPHGTRQDEWKDAALDEARLKICTLKYMRSLFPDRADYNGSKMSEGHAPTHKQWRERRDEPEKFNAYVAKRAAPPVAKFKRRVTA